MDLIGYLFFGAAAVTLAREALLARLAEKERLDEIERTAKWQRDRSRTFYNRFCDPPKL